MYGRCHGKKGQHNCSDAMAGEIKSIVDNNVFNSVKKSEGRTVVASRWLFTLNRKSQGNVQRYKAGLVAKGYSQIHIVDYNEVYTPVVKFATLRFLLAHVAIHDLEMEQVDVKTAFLHGKLDVEIYMDVPRLPDEVLNALKTRMSTPDVTLVGKYNGSGIVWNLRKSIYVLKQAARQWCLKLKGMLQNCKYEPSRSDPCLFVMDGKSSEWLYVLVHVDDIIISSKSSASCRKVVKMLVKALKLSVMYDAYFFLGRAIKRDRQRRRLWLSQGTYMNNLLSRFNLGARHVNIPVRTDLELQRATDNEMDNAKNFSYRELVGSLMYLAFTSLSYIMYAGSYLARYFTFYGHEYWQEAKRIVKYVSKTRTMSLCYGQEE